MLNTYIKNRGMTKTIFHNNNINKINQVNWDADYDGETAKILIDSNTNGKHNHYNISLNNEDLANLLNINGVNMPIHKRLEMDFREPMINHQDYFIELPLYDLKPKEPIIKEPSSSSIQQLFNKKISSPKSNEELIIPLTIDKKTADNYIVTPRRRHKRHKTHVTHRVFRRPKSSKSSKSRTSRTKTNRVKSLPVIELL